VATKKQKRLAGIAKREQEEAERRERGMHFLKMAQAERAEERAKAEAARKERAIAKSKRLARAHEAAKESKPGLHRTADKITKPRGKKLQNNSKRKKQYTKSRGQTQEAS
jgi:hypothetical protein